MAMRQGERMKLCIEQEREEEEKRRSGMPGAIDRGRLGWTRVRRDKLDWQVVQFTSPELD